MSGKQEKPTLKSVRLRHPLTVNPIPGAAACNWEGTHNSELLPELLAVGNTEVEHCWTSRAKTADGADTAVSL